MKTDDLIDLLAADPVPARPLGPALMTAWLGAVLFSSAAYLSVAGIRPDLGAALVDPVTIWKWLIPTLMATGGIALARVLSRPDGRAGWLPVILVLACGLAGWLIANRLLTLPVEEWGPAFRGGTLLICLGSVFAIGLPGLVATLLVLRRGATLRPRLAGLGAGLACGGAAATLYALHCTEDDPLFFVTWYGTAIFALGALGTVAGPRALHW
ncbi:NrsF family protein [Tabrizicola sp. BL-A-41-H6]|uniref:NrsF family protein n=1 Tax=Tabrizicola sp. BL-A-41-H6 TaxID=3421107 RepID=UPI003D66C8EF